MHTRRFRQKKSGYSGEARRPRAVALGYDPERDAAPRVLAAGQGFLAEEILDLARANGIAIREDPALAAALASVEVDQVIPPELYALVAEVLAYVYRLQEKGV
jgi:flagellar biosynthesis protein